MKSAKNNRECLWKYENKKNQNTKNDIGYFHLPAMKLKKDLIIFLYPI